MTAILTADETRAVMEIERENELIGRANVEIRALRAAGHKASGKRFAQGVEIKIERQGFRGPETSFLIIT